LLGIMLLVVGGLLMLFGRLNLPGDFVWRRGNVTIVFLLATSIVASIVLTILLNLFLRGR
jgi:ABC-type molybdate transport system permease subunit